MLTGCSVEQCDCELPHYVSHDSIPAIELPPLDSIQTNNRHYWKRFGEPAIVDAEQETYRFAYHNSFGGSAIYRIQNKGDYYLGVVKAFLPAASDRSDSLIHNRTFELSAHSSFYLTYLVTSNQADGGGTVQVGPNDFAPLNAGARLRLDTRTIASSERVVIPPTTAAKERELYASRLPRLREKARSMGLDRLLEGAAQERLGFVAAGMSYSYLQHALHLLGGLVALARTIRRAWSDGADPALLNLGVELCTVYWHYLLAVWLVLFFLLLNT